tara:strand:+ start:598 stop:933 length:336 start_codon:yes stop_codon:yes gene_type:complete
MKVNISYSVELDEIPGKVRDFLVRAAESSVGVQAGLKYLISMAESNVSIDEQLSQIDKIRRQMADIDYTLHDCSEILHGYEKALVQLREPQMPVPTIPEEPQNEQKRTEKP